MKKFHNPLSSTFGVFLGVVLIIAIVWYMQNGGNAFGTIQESVEINSVTVKEIIAPASELVTLKKEYTDFDTYENSKELFGKKLPFTTDKVIFTYSGVISAGIDLSEVELDVNNDKKTITITLPDAKILSHEIDEKSFEFYEIKNSILNETSFEDYTTLRAGLKERQEEKVLSDKEFMRSVEDSAENVIKGFLTSADATKDYKVIFK